MSVHLTHLRDLRVVREMSLRELAERSGVSKGLLSLAERGLYILDGEQVRAIEAVLEIRPGALAYRIVLVLEGATP